MSRLFLTFGLLIQTAGVATAQAPLWPDAGRGNMDPAYRHFLRSPYSYKAFSALGRGYAEQQLTPFSYESFAVEPSRLHQRVTPYGFESHQYVPGYAGSYADPWGYGGYGVPGYTRSYYEPRYYVPVPQR